MGSLNMSHLEMRSFHNSKPQVDTFTCFLKKTNTATQMEYKTCGL